MKLKSILILLTIICNTTIYAQTNELVWSDEFDYTGLPNSEKWSYDVGGHGWGNAELQYYTQNRTENARVENGKLIIEARKENYNGSAYTSARLVSRQKGDWLYGRIEVKAKLPSGTGSWPAIWMLPTDWAYGDWPNSGEIDIMEHVGYNPPYIYGTVHTQAYNHQQGTQQGGELIVENCESAFNIYAIEWNAEKIDFFVNQTLYFTFYNQGEWQKWPFDHRFHLLLNIAVGGNWGGVQGVDDTIFPIRMEIDYVRVYQQAGAVSISGNEFLEPQQTNAVFSASNIVGASYLWQVPSDATIVSGQGTSSITVNWGETEGDVILNYSNGDNNSTHNFFVKLVTIPNSEVFVFDNFNDLSIENISSVAGENNVFEFEEKNNELKIIYTINNPSAWPYFSVKLNRPVKLSEMGLMRVRLKTFNYSNSVTARIDLVDIKGVQTNMLPVFSLNQINDNGQYNVYSNNFTDNWLSSDPNYGAEVDAAKIIEAKIYVNYGFYGIAGKTDSLWIDYLEFTDPINNTENAKISNFNLKVYPNPTSDTFYVESILASEIKIFSAAGNLIYSTQSAPNERTAISVSDYKSGIYFIEVRNEKYSDTRKIIIQ